MADSNRREVRRAVMNYSDFTDFMMELDQESDRATAILAAAYLDVSLENLLRARMISESRVDELFGPSGSLGTFSAKAQTAYCLGLISELEYRDINHIRRIRNQFAHQLHGLSFNDQSIRDRCYDLRLPARVTRDSLPAQYKPPRGLFIISFALLTSFLDLRRVDAYNQQPQSPDELDIPRVTEEDFKSDIDENLSSA